MNNPGAPVVDPDIEIIIGGTSYVGAASAGLIEAGSGTNNSGWVEVNVGAPVVFEWETPLYTVAATDRDAKTLSCAVPTVEYDEDSDNVDDGVPDGTVSTNNPLTAPASLSVAVNCPEVEIRKELAPGSAGQAGAPLVVGDTVQYVLNVINDGNTPLTNIVVNDTFTTPSGASVTSTLPFPITIPTLAVGGVWVYPSTGQVLEYTITQADLNAASGALATDDVINMADITAVDEANVDIDNTANTVSHDIMADACVTLDKQFVFTDGSAIDRPVTPTDQIQVMFTVTNCGNVDLDPVRILDADLATIGIVDPTVINVLAHDPTDMINTDTVSHRRLHRPSRQ